MDRSAKYVDGKVYSLCCFRHQSDLLPGRHIPIKQL